MKLTFWQKAAITVVVILYLLACAFGTSNPATKNFFQSNAIPPSSGRNLFNISDNREYPVGSSVARQEG